MNAPSLYTGILPKTGSTAMMGGSSSGGGPGPTSIPGMFVALPSMTTAEIQAGISSSVYNVIWFAPGSYTLTAVLNVNRSNVSLVGNQAVLTQVAGTNAPNIFVGQMVSSPSIQYTDISVSGFVLDGFGATSQYWSGGSFITNNAIGVSYCKGVTVSDCEFRNTASGGMTITFNSQYVNFDTCSAHGNTFDGFTAYTCTDCSFTGCQAYSNGASGLSFDNNVARIAVSNCSFSNNTQNGVFARWSSYVTLTGCTINSNSQNGLFLSGYNASPDQNIQYWTICDNTVSGNTQQGLFLQSLVACTVTGNSVAGNGGNGLNITSYGSTPANGVSKNLTITGNSVTANTGVGVYNDSSNSSANGASGDVLDGNSIAGNTGGQIVGDYTAWTVSTLGTVPNTSTGGLVINTGAGTLYQPTNGLGLVSSGGVQTIGTTDSNRLVLQTAGATAMTLTATGVAECNFGIQSGIPTVSNGSLTLCSSGSANAVTIAPSSSTALYSMTLPPAQGSASQVMVNNGSGALSWQSVGAVGWSPSWQFVPISGTVNITALTAVNQTVLTMSITTPSTGSWACFVSLQVAASGFGTADAVYFFVNSVYGTGAWCGADVPNGTAKKMFSASGPLLGGYGAGAVPTAIATIPASTTFTLTLQTYAYYVSGPGQSFAINFGDPTAAGVYLGTSSFSAYLLPR